MNAMQERHVIARRAVRPHGLDMSDTICSGPSLCHFREMSLAQQVGETMRVRGGGVALRRPFVL